MDIREFCRRLPKVELHAHLNGSIDNDTLYKLMDLYKAKHEELPLEASDKSIYAIKQGETRTLAQCFDVFRAIHALTGSEEAISIVAKDVVQGFANDGVRYLELRTTPKDTPTSAEYVRTVIDALKTAQDKHQGAIVVRLILSIDRRGSVEKALETVRIAAQNKPFVVGVDFSGDPTHKDARDFQSAWDLARQKDLKLAIHFAEIKNTEESLYIVNELKADRIGHGCFMQDGVEDAVLKAQIPLEICMSSNVMGQSVKDYDDHHFHDLYEKDYPCAISTDDMGVFSTTLSHEYAMAARKLDIPQPRIWDLSYRTIDFIFAEVEVKDQLREIWNSEKVLLANSAKTG
ncbi:hypothetical protein SARC_11113 [Sphaeroforma arctica JP610]|uniref:Adenosine deaminase domain-containing protein n=1 Tax=Sphaeroforma arctica JP610 TaxID=667725 RepID=A0A0L0FHZ4_9EUKA|nr:hypothetical protein SARC_11113 [Sphaeroforma arctica JP610]KNC76385.1 hypothetical protein SARC_11113 [Sphaeroforma arctica JP610]|eukprot:XP_014150287.1 hypothetical protein SARC_11113 [Sphaeroforma arctica JP610]